MSSSSSTRSRYAPHAAFPTVLGAMALLVSVVLPSSASAEYPSLQSPPDLRGSNGDVAVVFAAEDYVFLPDVRGAVRNANAWETFFREGLGIDETFVRTDSNVTREDMLDFAGRAADMAGEESRVWFVFIGHGAPTPDGQDGLLVGVDAQSEPDSLEARGLPRSQLVETLREGDQAETIVLLDACFSGNSRDRRAIAEGMQPVVPTETNDDRVDGDSFAILTAAQSDQFAGALPGADRPAFSYLLLGALHGWADDGDGRVTVEEALTYTRQALRRLDHTQTPILTGGEEFVLAEGVEASDPGMGRLMAAARQARSSTRPDRSTDSADRTTTDGGGPTDSDCPDGKVQNDDTAGHCCWPGQAWNGRRCVGEPTECPDGRRPDPEAENCALPECAEGKVRAADGIHCCWPNQAWSSAKKQCIGDPECPDGWVRTDGGCDRDSDDDGILDGDDQCPDEPEDRDGFEDDDGCPDPDNDGDDIPDDEDACPDEPEDVDDYEDEDGCPDPDNDGDGIPDDEDRCPNEPEDDDGVRDGDGCPESDADGDGIPDGEDECPTRPEDPDGFADSDGCPEPRDGEISPVAFVLGGMGGAGMVGGGGMLVASALRQSRLASQIESGSITHTEALSRARRTDTLRRYGWSVLGAGTAAAATGAIWTLLDPDPLFGDGRATLVVTPAPTLTGLTLRIRTRVD